MSQYNIDAILDEPYTPIGGPVESGARPVFSNVDTEERTNNRSVQVSRELPDIFHDFVQLSGQPKSVGGKLYLPTDGEPVEIKKPQQLLAHIERQARVEWRHGEDRCPPERFLEYVTMKAEVYEAIERYPHFPALPTFCYFHREVPRGDGQKLEEFIDFFSPATPEDRQLMKAFVITLFWGGNPGCRPLWIFTADADDVHQGRGTGKSTFVQLAAELCGRFLSVSPKVKFEDTIKRFLSPEGLRYRVARIDNLKSLRFSWAELEECLTSQVISGHEMYRGEGRRPNTLIWALTVNSPGVSKDIAQRAVVVRMGRPQHRPGWENEVRRFVEANRWSIIADVKAELESVTN
ncbi:MAG: hypothetical protein HQ518_17655 [Rhodopirellula sp.]|nr:hypothetical protein [Rhodopirellula sp.]